MNSIFDEILMQCKETFTFKRISSEHPLDLYLGYDEFGKKTLALITNEIDLIFPSTKLIEVKISTREDKKKSLRFSLKNDTETGIFYKVCEDIFESTKFIKKDDALIVINNRWNSWINMFKNPHSLIMSEKEVRGLIAELVFLRDYMFDKYGIQKSIESWLGPENSHKDIEVDDTWYEIKACYQSSKTVEISSVEQLDACNDGYLCIVELENSNRYVNDNITLNKIVKQLLDMMDEEMQKKLMEKIGKVGYSYFDEYDNYIYYCKNITHYIVNKDFPRLMKKDLPKEIFTVSYELLIPNIRDFIRG